jgi:hypothetical protein
LVAALAVLAPPGAGAAGPRVDPDRPELARTTVVTGARPAWMAVRLPAPATVATTFDSTPDLEVKGRGRFVGFALVPDDPEVPVLLGGRLPKSSGNFHLLMPILGQIFHSGILQLYGERTTMPAGDYRLYLLPDGAPATVRLTLRGLTGRTILRPSSPARYVLETPEVYSPEQTPNYYSAGTVAALDSRGLIFQALWVRLNAHLEGIYHFCWYDKAELEEQITTQVVPPQVQYGPGCAGPGGGLTEDRRVDLEPHVKLYYEGVAPLPKGDYGQGFYFATASVVRKVGHVTMWLSYD